jgi:sorting nexin-4
LQEAVTTAHETADAFSDEVLKENAIFQYAKESEMRELLLILAEGQIEMYRAVGFKFHMPTVQMLMRISQASEEWDRVIPVLQRIRVDV